METNLERKSSPARLPGRPNNLAIDFLEAMGRMADCGQTEFEHSHGMRRNVSLVCSALMDMVDPGAALSDDRAAWVRRAIYEVARTSTTNPQTSVKIEEISPLGLMTLALFIGVKR